MTHFSGKQNSSAPARFSVQGHRILFQSVQRREMKNFMQFLISPIEFLMILP